MSYFVINLLYPYIRVINSYEFQFHGSVHHISVNENINLMQQS